MRAVNPGGRVKFLILVSFPLLFLAGCVSEPVPQQTPDIDQPRLRKVDPNQDLKGVLGMNRPAEDLGFDEKPFNPCSFGAPGPNGCGTQYLAVLNFQMLCRDSEGTVTDAPVALEPIAGTEVQWKVGATSGDAYTDERGYGQLSVLGPAPARGQRLTLRFGAQYVAFEVSEVSKVVLPKNFCRR